MPKGVYDHSKRENKREAILDAATTVYAHYGFEGATLVRMAEAAGVTKSLVLQYFGSKQGIVEAIANRTAQKNLAYLAAIDEISGITLRQRAAKRLQHIQTTREEWCLTIGTFLVPSFQYHMRGEIARYMQVEYQAVLGHLDEFITPTPEVAYAYAYANTSMGVGFIVDGRLESYLRANKVLQDTYLRPEAEIIHGTR